MYKSLQNSSGTHIITVRAVVSTVCKASMKKMLMITMVNSASLKAPVDFPTLWRKPEADKQLC